MLDSPFPGMDPFLEEPTRWRSVHTRLINAISDQLAGMVAPRFYADHIDYSVMPPKPALRPEELQWLRAQIHRSQLA